MAKFLTGTELENAICGIVYDAKRNLLIMSPFIKLDDYFKNVFNSLVSNANIKVVIAFGKNENQINKSFNSADFEYFKKFPNISIVFIPQLHAKYYANENKGIITSVNLYDYSFKNNIEFGLISENNVLGKDRFDTDAWNKAMEVLTNNSVVFVRIPKFNKKLLRKDYVGSETLYDETETLINKGTLPKKSIFDFQDIEFLSYGGSIKKMTRDEFESNRNTENSLIIKEPQSSQSFSGHCISCGHKCINLDPRNPICEKCISSDTKIKNGRFCHICGEKANTSKIKPSCYECYLKTKNSLDYFIKV